MKNKILTTLFIFSLSLSQCTNAFEGGSEAGNPSLRDVTGSVSDSQASAPGLWLRQAYASGSCPADQVISTNTLAETSSVDIASDCSFTLSLEVGNSYSLSFWKDQTVVGILVFQATTNSESSQFTLTQGDTAVDLGVIFLGSGTASPQNNPLEQNDRDDDGVNDFDDTDDDDDGIDDDEDYLDCDGDGILDNDECEDNSECDEDDADCDGVKDENDNCIDVANEDQDDENNNDVGDVCE